MPLEEVGAVPLAVAVDPQEGDVRPDNDRRTVNVQVADDKARVLLVDGEARWEFRYLRNALARDPRVSVESVVFHQPAGPLGRRCVHLRPRPARARRRRHADPLGGFDALIVGDLDPADATPEFWSRLDAYVGRAGRDARRRARPAVVGGAGGRTRRRGSSCPCSTPARPTSTPRPTTLRTPACPRACRSSRPTRRVPDAGVLADAPARRRPRRVAAALGRPAPAPLGDRRQGQAGGDRPGHGRGDDPSRVILAAQPYGLGKVLWVGTDGTWRWRHRVGDAYHHRFWGQVVRWAAGGKLAAGNAFVRFGPTRPRAGEGEPVRIQARISEGVAGVGPDLLIAARVFRAGPGRPGEAVAVVPLAARWRASRGRSRGSPRACPLGRYVVRLDAPGLADALRLAPAARRRPRGRAGGRRATAPSASSWPPPATRSTASPPRPAARSSPTSRPTSSPPAPRPDPGDRPHRGDPALGLAPGPAALLRDRHRRVGRPQAGRAPLTAACGVRTANLPTGGSIGQIRV